MKKSRQLDFSYHFNIFLRNVAKELLRTFYHTAYRILRPGKRFYCENIFAGKNGLVFSNGEITCVCADHGLINLGNVNQASLEEIWRGAEFQKLRDAFQANRLPLRHCSACFALKKIYKPTPDLYQIAPFFWNIHIETTPVCNLDCAICRRDEVEKHRGGTQLSKATVYKTLDEIIKHKTNKFVLFFGFGEPLLDRNVYEYMTYLKERFPEVIVSISTNGIPLDNEQNVNALLKTPLDVIVFSIDGITPEAYVKYRRGGDFNRALGGMTRLCQERRKRGQKHPLIIWQYLYFRWNDSDEAIRATIRKAREIGVDILHFLPTRTPITGISWKNQLRRNHGVIYKFGGVDHDYNPHDRARVIHVSNEMEDIPL
jgi:MoaA/NifB/PqqE/SkfB family radical SAM enzyme